MSIFRSAVFLAAIAGLCAGLVTASMQSILTVPLILKAETYERAASPGGSTHSHAEGGEHQHGGGQAWSPADGLERTAFTVLANVAGAIGFALLLVAVSELLGGITGWRQGLAWGLAGFAVFTFAPGLGLPAELPGMPSAELVPRQIWWIATAAATAAGLALIAFGQRWPLAVVGVALIVLPHLIGAPQPDTHDTRIPADLHRRFIVATTITSLVFWLVLGTAIGVLKERFAGGLSGRAASPSG
jgi:cobalt transporter subunit CbtA